MAELRPCPTKSARGGKTRSNKSEEGMSEAEKNAISAALDADCVLVVCQQCQDKADVTMLLQRLSDTANQSAIKVQQLNKQVENLEASLSGIRKELKLLSDLPAPEMLKTGLDDLERMREQIKEQGELPQRVTYAESAMKNLQNTVEKTEQEWKVVKNKDPVAPADIQKTVRDSVKVIKDEEARRRNLLLYNVKESNTGSTETDKRNDVRYFIVEVATTCGVGIVPDDIEDCLRLGAPATDKKRPMMIKLSESGAAKNKLIFKNLQKFRSHQRDNQGPEDAGKPLVSVADDLTEDQRKERKRLLEEASRRNGELPSESSFLWAVRGPAWNPELKKITKQRR